MQATRLAIAGIAVLAAGCAATTTNTSAEAQCQYFARSEGFDWVRDVKSEPAGGATGVTMELKDTLGRKFNATCLHANGQTRWAAALPANAVRRDVSRDTAMPPAGK